MTAPQISLLQTEHQIRTYWSIMTDTLNQDLQAGRYDRVPYLKAEIDLALSKAEELGIQLSGERVAPDYGDHFTMLRNTDYVPRQLPYGGYVFVMCRPRQENWSDYDGSINKIHTGNEFRPCMLSGHGDGQSISVHGSQYRYKPEEFEIGQDCSPVFTCDGQVAQPRNVAPEPGA